ncbi:hypothetical protein D6833_09330 [Candidatus Parcubacteria bacterium]|nr:MAG: hypothetical protein D6833_09330 [Candidatus Parcubacteria bacterium]
MLINADGINTTSLNSQGAIKHVTAGVQAVTTLAGTVVSSAVVTATVAAVSVLPVPMLRVGSSVVGGRVASFATVFAPIARVTARVTSAVSSVTSMSQAGSIRARQRSLAHIAAVSKAVAGITANIPVAATPISARLTASGSISVGWRVHGGVVRASTALILGSPHLIGESVFDSPGWVPDGRGTEWVA